jgi:hypothetical protein
MREMLERILAHTDEGGSVLYTAITAPGPREAGKLRKLERAGFVERMPHPTIIDPIGGLAAAAIRITSAGRRALRMA